MQIPTTPILMNSTAIYHVPGIGYIGTQLDGAEIFRMRKLNDGRVDLDYDMLDTVTSLTGQYFGFQEPDYTHLGKVSLPDCMKIREAAGRYDIYEKGVGQVAAVLLPNNIYSAKVAAGIAEAIYKREMDGRRKTQNGRRRQW